MNKEQSRSARRKDKQLKEQRQRRITILVVIVILVAFSVIMIRACTTSPNSSETGTPAAETGAASANEMAWGPPDALVVVEEYGDFQ